ncbi:MAG: DUF4381 domain-containing protein [Gallionella sp.]
MNPDLSQLRDIHLPAPVSWWPPAPGWWLLLMIVLLAISVSWFVYRRRKLNAWRRTALDVLKQLRVHNQSDSASAQRVVGELSILMRRVAISRFPREAAAKLSGDAWLKFLDQSRRNGTGFQSSAGELLVVAPYAQEMKISTAEINQLFELCEHWIVGLPAGERP